MFVRVWLLSTYEIATEPAEPHLVSTTLKSETLVALVLSSRLELRPHLGKQVGSRTLVPYREKRWARPRSHLCIVRPIY